MRLIWRLEADGAFLFRWRSFVPLTLLLVAVPAFWDAMRVEAAWGDAADHLWVFGCMGVAYLGLAIRCLVAGFAPAGTSGRNTRKQRAETLNTDGPYSVVRNPLYVGNFIILLGVVASMTAWWLVALFALAYWIYIERVVAAEEAFLTVRFGSAYEAWARQTPCFLPRLSQWRHPALPFSIRTVLRREYNGFFGIAAAFLFLEMIGDLLFEHEPFYHWVAEDEAWVGLFAVGLSVFLVLRTLKKTTRVLQVPGR